MLHGPKSTQKRAVEQRETMSLPEVLLWTELRKRPDGLKFRRQHPAGVYILDFFCARAQLAVEVDGMAHETGNRPERDEKRDRWLSERGIRVLRITAEDVLRNPDGAVRHIVATARG